MELASATWCWCVTSSPWWSGRKWRTSVPLLTLSILSWGSVFGPQAFFNNTDLFLSDGIINVQISYSYTRIKSITLKSLKFLPHVCSPSSSTNKDWKFYIYGDSIFIDFVGIPFIHKITFPTNYKCTNLHPNIPLTKLTFQVNWPPQI